MLGYFDLRKGVRFIYEGQPWEVLDFNHMKKAQREGIAQIKMKNLVSGKVMDQSFHSNDNFEEADIQKLAVKYLYNHKNRFFFCYGDDASKRFDLDEAQMGTGARFLKANETIDAFLFAGEIINISLPIKVQLKVAEAPPGVKGDRAQGGMKSVVLETKAVINAPLFIKTGDILEINTETGEYVRRAE